MYIFTKRYFYSVEGVFTEEDIKKTDEVICRFINSLRYIEDDVRERNEEIVKEREKGKEKTERRKTVKKERYSLQG